MRYTTRSIRITTLAKKSKFQIHLEYWLARLLLAFFAALPLPIAMRLGSALAGLGRLFPRLRRTAESNLKLAFPEISELERQRLMRGCFENLGRLLAIFSHFTKSNPAPLEQLIQAEGLEHLIAAKSHAKSRGRGIILYTGHIGAWELTSFGLSMLGHPFNFLVRRIDNPKIEELIDRARMHRGNRTINKRSAAREMLQILQTGGILGLLVDLNALDREGIFVDFFNVPASTTFIVAKLALRTGAEVLPVFAPWDKSHQKIRLTVGQPVTFEPTNNQEENVRRLTQSFTRVVEDCIRRYPDQWLWIHRRWKTRPAGESEIY
ncbi:MAG TPA: lysophospholipid acyltransferase family protein [Pyrinomonadaceae bacterium]|nr:lysophospholipid acyltransferase family protein [Pyrinomonadaceae bacterium]